MGRRVIAIIIALVVAVFGTFGVVAYAQGADSRAVAGQATQEVYVATGEVPTGTSAAEAVAQKLIVRQRVVTRGVPVGALKDVGTVTGGLVATSAIMRGEIVIASRFGTVANQAQSKAVPVGKLAVTIELSDPSRISPLLAPGSHIVVYDSFNVRDAKAGDPLPDGAHLSDQAAGVRSTKVLLEDVEVIAVGDTTTLPAPTPKPTADSDRNSAKDRLTAARAEVSKALVTVAVTPEQAVRLIHAVQTGELYAALRGVDVKVNPQAFTDDNSVLKR
jgi:pilus assembly protein CpaB